MLVEVAQQGCALGELHENKCLKMCDKYITIARSKTIPDTNQITALQCCYLMLLVKTTCGNNERIYCRSHQTVKAKSEIAPY